MLHRPRPRAQAPAFAVPLDSERLDAYAVAMAFQPIAAPLARRLTGSFRDQLDRASLSLLLNLAEGVARTQPADKARFYSGVLVPAIPPSSTSGGVTPPSATKESLHSENAAISRGSASECAALLDALQARGLAE